MKSYDIFDTLLARNYYYNDSHFDLIENDYNIENFKWKRKHAENEVSEKTLDKIYDYLYINYNIDRNILNVELDYELKNIYKIYKNSIDLAINDILVSDTYYNKSQLKMLLEKIEIVKYNNIYCSYGGKQSGTVWKEYNLNPELHIGDNIHSDVEMPKQNGIKTQHYIESQFTDNEKWLEKHGYFYTACLCRKIRLLCPYEDIERKSIWLEQSNVNIPILILLSNYFSKLDYDFLFSLRDCFHLYNIFSTMYPDKNAKIFQCSRLLYNYPSKEYKDYVSSIVKNTSLIIDLQGTGNSFLNMFGNTNNYFTIINSDLNYKNNIKYLVHRNEGFSDNIERINYVNFGQCVDYNVKAEYPNNCYTNVIMEAMSLTCKELKDGFKFDMAFNLDILKDFLRYLENNCIIKKYVNHEVQ